MSSLSVKIGGAAGDGVASSGEMLARALVRGGLYVSAYNSYQSVIRGGHVYFDVRASDEKVFGAGEVFDILVALDEKTILIHGRNATHLIYDDARITCPQECPASRFPLPLSQIAKKYSKNPILQNTVALGACMHVMSLDLSLLEGVLRDTFKDKGEETVSQNVSAVREGNEFAKGAYAPLGHTLAPNSKKRMLLTGNGALSMGAVAAGCRFYTAYPMTPASSILHTLAAHAEQCGMLVKQTEDELAAINMAIGASFAGVRAMCGTSGGGFALMTEAFGLAGMLETPIVVVLSQRPGPSTGLPTKTGQGDLNMMLGAGQDDFPRAIISPLDVADCHYAAGDAFRIAEKYQIPVIVALDFYLSEHFETVDELSLEKPFKREFAHTGPRYLDTETGVSPRPIPGQEGLMFIASSDEHDEAGKNISDVRAGLPDSQAQRKKIMEKRMRKLEFLRREMDPPKTYGPADADITLVCWGSSFGACMEAQDMLRQDGIVANVLAFRYLFPLHPQTGKILEGCERLCAVEQNYTGQMARLIAAETGIVIGDAVREYSGEPLYPGKIATRIKEMVK